LEGCSVGLPLQCSSSLVLHPKCTDGPTQQLGEWNSVHRVLGKTKSQIGGPAARKALVNFFQILRTNSPLDSRYAISSGVGKRFFRAQPAVQGDLPRRHVIRLRTAHHFSYLHEIKNKHFPIGNGLNGSPRRLIGPLVCVLLFFFVFGVLLFERRRQIIGQREVPELKQKSPREPCQWGTPDVYSNPAYG